MGAGEAARIFTGGLLPERQRHYRHPGEYGARRETVVVTRCAAKGKHVRVWKGWISSAARCFFAKGTASATATLRSLRR